MKIKRIIHVAALVDSMDKAKHLYADILGLPVRHEELYQGRVEICFLPVGDSQLELCAPLPPADGSAAAVPSQGIDHVAFEVEDIQEAVRELESRGIGLRPEGVVRGAEGSTVAFLDPAATMGVLIELVQPAQAAQPPRT